MKRKLFVAALAMVGGCDHRFGIGALEPDAGADAQTSSVGGEDAQSLLAIDVGGGAPPDNAADAGMFRPLVPGPTTWTGYIDGYQFPSGSNAIRFAVSVDANGRVTGMVVLGDGPPPPLATDPNVGYPPDFLVLAENAPSGLYWAEGFAYSMSVATAAPWLLRFAIGNSELWSDWCAEQTPVDASGKCLPNRPGAHIIGTNGSPDQCYQQDPANGRKTVVDCGKYEICINYPYCTCSTTACVSDPTGSWQAMFYLAIPDNTATGTVEGIANSTAIVHFTQDP
jgi:hypothetical protein